MIPLAGVALAVFGMGLHVHLKLVGKAFTRVPEKKWRRWINHPDERKGPVGHLLDCAAAGASLKDNAVSFQELRTTEVAPFERDLGVMRVLVGAAPLLGLLGTVTGMLATFSALASGAGGEKTMAMIASGISEALITTETGLVIALPGLFFQYQLTRRLAAFKSFLAHLETVCTQEIHRRIGKAAKFRQPIPAGSPTAAVLTERTPTPQSVGAANREPQSWPAFAS
ncbi:MotA/TolQ/ExbB proton channel family protein [bacterium]|nr:MotA/TolQ/ExbB proton channel family protein [bacterium]